MDDPEVINAINEYYRLKSEYEKTLYNEKISIINNTSLSKEDKLKKYKLFKPKCINCKQPVGTVFTTNTNKLSAKCGATKSVFQKNFNPCQLDIQIEKGNIELLSNIIDEFSIEKELDKDEIIKTKLNYFFNFRTEDETISDFKEQKKSYMENMETYIEYLDEFNDKVNNIENKKEIDKTLIDINESKEKIKSYIQSYKEEEKKEYLKEAVTEYKDVLQNLINKYNSLQYKYYNIESIKKKDTDGKDDNQVKIHNLLKKIYTVNDIEFVIDAKFKIVSNKK